jgi:chitodextrinase
VQGTIASYEIQPYAVLNLEDYMFQQGCRRQTLGGVGYDRQRGLVYIMEREVAVDMGKPIVHVFRLAEQGQAADVTPPTVPTNLRVDAATDTQVDFSWDAASDNTHLVGYIIYRYGEPIATTTKTFYRDNKVNPSATYTYTVVAWDASNNLSAPGTLVVTTPGGTDTRIPILSNIKYSSLSATGITIRWHTDVPATTVFTYGVEYSGNDLVYQDETLTCQHQAVLGGLTPESTYYIPAFVSTDAASHTNTFQVENWQFTTSPAGSALNFRPILNGIGSKRVAVGEQVEFSLSAIDRDADDVLTYSAADLPPGATFTPTTRQFSWTPTAAGMYRITFAVSDGDQTDSERVTIFVTSSGN